MIKKLLSVTIALILIFGSAVMSVSAQVDDKYQAAAYSMGDINTDGKIDTADCLNIIKFFAKEAKNVSLDYENADLNGDSASNMSDFFLLKKYLAGHDVEINQGRFLLNDSDVTDELYDLGRNNYDVFSNSWTDKDSETIMARNPYDMISCDGKVYVTGGNYQSNKGPVQVCYYTRNLNKFGYSISFDTEQSNRFYMFDGDIFALSTDSRYWTKASFYIKPSASLSFRTRANVLNNNIHCYDMIKYDDTYFFCGSAVSYDKNILNYNGNQVEMSKGIIHRYTGTDITRATSSEFEEATLINKYGEALDYSSYLIASTKTDGTTYYLSIGLPRIYDFFEFGGELYAFYYDSSADWYDEMYDYGGKYNFNGLYKYDKESKNFIYDATLSIDGIVEMFNTSQDREKINHDFEIDGKYYIIGEKMIVTDDLKNYKDFVIPNYEEYNVNDMLSIAGKYYLLASGINDNGDYTTYVLETEDMENFRPILHFDSLTFTRSFEYTNGAFFFGLGARIDENGYISTECGRIYRYVYYK